MSAFVLAETLRPNKNDDMDVTISASILSVCLDDIIAQHTILFQLILLSNLPTNASEAHGLNNYHRSYSRKKYGSKKLDFDEIFGEPKSGDNQTAKGALRQLSVEVSNLSNHIPKLGASVAQLKRPGLQIQERLTELQTIQNSCSEFRAALNRHLLTANDLDFSGLPDAEKLTEFRRRQVLLIFGLTQTLESARSSLANVEKIYRAKAMSKIPTGVDILTAPNAREKIWPRLKLPIKFTAVNKHTEFSLEAQVPGIPPENIQVLLANGGRGLSVSACRFPTLEDVRALYKDVLARAKERRETLAAHTEATMILNLAEGKFGEFKNIFSLPDGVDASNVSVKLEADVLRITVPKLLRTQSVSPFRPLSPSPRVPELQHAASDRLAPSSSFFDDLSKRSMSMNPFAKNAKLHTSPRSLSPGAASPGNEWTASKQRVKVDPPTDNTHTPRENGGASSSELPGVSQLNLSQVRNTFEDEQPNGHPH